MKPILNFILLFGRFLELLLIIYFIIHDLITMGAAEFALVDDEEYEDSVYERLRYVFPNWVSVMFSVIFWFILYMQFIH